MSRPKEYETALDIRDIVFNDPEYNSMVNQRVAKMLDEIRDKCVAVDVRDDEDHCGVFMGPTDREIPAVRIRVRVYGHKRSVPIPVDPDKTEVR